MIHFHTLSLFPQSFSSYLNESIIGKAQEKNLIQLTHHNLREFALNKYGQVDDTPYGGGAGMVIRVDVLVPAIRRIKQNQAIDKVLLLSPRGFVFNQAKAKSFSQLKSLLLVCGRYEGVDQRAIDLEIDEEISIGDYVLTGGELPAQVIIDATTRLLPGVLGTDESSEDESHTQGLLEYPHYTRPADFEGHPVPPVLVSGHHAEIEKWRKQQSQTLTQQRRPDLIESDLIDSE